MESSGLRLRPWGGCNTNAAEKGPALEADHSHLIPRATDALTCVKPDISSLPNFLNAILVAAAATAVITGPLPTECLWSV